MQLALLAWQNRGQYKNPLSYGTSGFKSLLKFAGSVLTLSTAADDSQVARDTRAAELRWSEIDCVAIWRLLELFEKNMEDKMVDCVKRKRAIEKENEEGIFVIGIKVKGNGWEANRAFSDSHEVGRFIKKVVGEVKAVRISRGDIVIVECESTEQRDRALKIR